MKITETYQSYINLYIPHYYGVSCYNTLDYLLFIFQNLYTLYIQSSISLCLNQLFLTYSQTQNLTKKELASFFVELFGQNIKISKTNLSGSLPLNLSILQIWLLTSIVFILPMLQLCHNLTQELKQKKNLVLN